MILISHTELVCQWKYSLQTVASIYVFLYIILCSSIPSPSIVHTCSSSLARMYFSICSSTRCPLHSVSVVPRKYPHYFLAVLHDATTWLIKGQMCMFHMKNIPSGQVCCVSIGSQLVCFCERFEDEETAYISRRSSFMSFSPWRHNIMATCLWLPVVGCLWP